MKKSQLLSSQLVILVVLAVSLVVLLIVYFDFGDVLRQEAEKRNCQWNLLLSSLSKTPVLGIETIPPDCRMTRVDITKEQLESRKSANKKEILKFNKKYPSLSYEHFYLDDVNREKKLLEYEMDRIIANEIKDCWELAWMGQMPIFKEWWSLIECKEGKECECKGNEKECGLIKDILRRASVWNVQLKRPPAFCVLCSRIKFDDLIKDKFSEEIKSLPEWMQKHPVIGDPQQRSYYEYAMDDVNRGLFVPDYKYDVSEPLAVVYARTNVFKPTQYAEMGLKLIGIKDPSEVKKPINVLSIMPYSEVGERCTYIIG